MPRSATSPRDAGGFVLLEVLVALLIFTTIVLAWSSSCDRALDAAREANTLRMLRMLTARKIAEVLARPNSFRDGAEASFQEEATERTDDSPFRDYYFKVETEEVVAAGYTADEDAAFLFDRDKDGGPPAVPQGGKAPDPIKMLRYTVTVSFRPEGTGDGMQMRVVTYGPVPEEEKPAGGGL